MKSPSLSTLYVTCFCDSLGSQITMLAVSNVKVALQELFSYDIVQQRKYQDVMKRKDGGLATVSYTPRQCPEGFFLCKKVIESQALCVMSIL